MHNFENNSRIYMYDCLNQKWLYVFPSYDDLLLFLAKEVKKNADLSFLKPFKSRYLNDINMTGEDVKVWNEIYYSNGMPHVKEHVELRQYMFIDEQYRTIDPRCDYKHIQELAEQELTDVRYMPLVFKNLSKDDNNLPEFRKEPVPRTGKRKHGNIIRHPQSYREKRQNSDPEHYDFVRASRRLCHLPDPWEDEKFRPFPKCWKDCTKRKHQYKETTQDKNPESLFIYQYFVQEFHYMLNLQPVLIARLLQ